MPKKPTFSFEPDPFLRDVAALSLHERGAWITILCLLHHASERGEMTHSVTEWATALGCSRNVAVTVLKSLLSQRICDGNYESDDVITLVSRRMQREHHSSLLLNLRQKSFRERKRREEGESEREWTAELRRLYDHVDFDFELGKAQRWITDHPGRHFTKRFFAAWLNKIPRPVKGLPTNGTLTAAVAWAEIEAHRQGGKVPYTHPAIQATVKAIGGIFAGDITTTQLDVKRGQFLRMFPDIYKATAC